MIQAIRNRILINVYSTISLDASILHKAVSQCRQAPALLSRCNCIHLLQSQIKSPTILQIPKSNLNVSIENYRDKSSKQRSSEYESESDSDEETVNIPGSKILTVQTESLRCDSLLKQGIGISRNKLEVLFYEGRIRVNGKKISKKSQDVKLGDEIDLIKNVSEDNPDFIIVSRLEIMKARPTGDLIVLTIRRTKTLLIENYETHPWVEPSTEKSEENS